MGQENLWLQFVSCTVHYTCTESGVVLRGRYRYRVGRCSVAFFRQEDPEKKHLEWVIQQSVRRRGLGSMGSYYCEVSYRRHLRLLRCKIRVSVVGEHGWLTRYAVFRLLTFFDAQVVP